MKNVNFDTLKNLQAPEEWIENAISIQNQEQQNKLIPFSRFSRNFAMVASLIFVCMVSVAVFLSSDRNIVPVISDTQSSESKTSQSDCTKHQEETKVESKAEKETESATHPSEDSTLNGDAPNEGDNKKPTSLQITSPTTSESENPSNSPTLALPSDKPNDQPTTPQGGTQPPSTPATPGPNPVVPGPGESAGDESQNPTNSETQRPTEKPADPQLSSETKCTAVFAASSDDAIYCKLYDVNGRIMGSMNLLAHQKKAESTDMDNGMVYAVYYPVKMGVITQKGTYTYHFYNKSGFVLYSGTITC